jgi:hypothetical protein
MVKKILKNKSPAVVIITLLILISATCSAGNINSEKNSYAEDDLSKKNTLILDEPGYFLSGTKGENNWYITCVQLSFNWNPDLVKEVWVFLNGAWKKYTSTVEICLDGYNNIPWKWIDIDDQEHLGTPIPIKIDKTPPTVKLEKRIVSETEIEFTAKVTDPASGCEYVDIYLDGKHEVTDSEEPYTYTWVGNELQTVRAEAFDYAGHMGYDEANTKSRSRNVVFNELMLRTPLQRIIDIFLWCQKIFLGLEF